MKAAPLEYLRPGSVEEAVRMLDEHLGLARVLAGGQSLVPMLHMRLMRPSAVVDVNRLGDELGGIDARASEVVIGALARYVELERSPVIAERLPILQHVVSYIGDPQVRNRGTLGGALAQSDPTGEVPLACLALGARVVARSVRGRREIAVEDFFAGSYANVLEPDELIVSVHFPPSPAHCSFFEVGRKHNDFATVSVLAMGSADGAGRWSGVRLALGGVSDTPVLAREAMELLEGQRWDAALIERAAERSVEAIDPPDDVRATAEYRRHLAAVHVGRVLGDLQARGAAG